VLSWVVVQASTADWRGFWPSEPGSRWCTRVPLGAGEFKARDAVLTVGRRGGEPGRAADALASVWGVRVVDNKAGLLDKAETYLWSASRRNHRIRLRGFAPSISARIAILGVTKASFRDSKWSTRRRWRAAFHDGCLAGASALP